MLSLDLTGKRALVAGVADDNGFGFAIAKSLAEAGASVSVATWPPALNIFRNLIDNALKYGGDPAEVEITVRPKKPEHVWVRVTDNGRGIPVSQRWRIFMRFVRLGSELERDKPGTGLGLYLVQTLVDRLKGRIRVRDREGGSGTAFEVTLPTRKPETTSAPKPPAESTAVS